jgi:hypothetical protein
VAEEQFIIKPGDQQHTELEWEIAQFIIEHGGITAKGAYHDVMPKIIIERLRKDFSWTGQYLRGRSDRIAIFKNGKSFQWEAKTHKSKMYRDMTLEALPLAHHILDSKLGVKCLYCHQDLYDHNHHKGFWVDDMPCVRDIQIPKILGSGWLKFSQDGQEELRRMLRLIWPNVPVYFPEKTRGSGDAFIVIEEYEKQSLKDWHDLILEWLE